MPGRPLFSTYPATQNVLQSSRLTHPGHSSPGLQSEQVLQEPIVVPPTERTLSTQLTWLRHIETHALMSAQESSKPQHPLHEPAAISQLIGG